MSTSNKNLGSPHLTPGYADPELVRQMNKTAPGMAFWASTGPFGTSCKECAFYGFTHPIRDSAGNTITTVSHRHSCSKFYQMANKVGPTVPPQTESCKYFEHKKEKDA
jgi:hypothetical protein